MEHGFCVSCTDVVHSCPAAAARPQKNAGSAVHWPGQPALFSRSMSNQRLASDDEETVSACLCEPPRKSQKTQCLTSLSELTMPHETSEKAMSDDSSSLHTPFSDRVGLWAEEMRALLQEKLGPYQLLRLVANCTA